MRLTAIVPVLAVAVLLPCAACVSIAAAPNEGRHADTLSLNGRWEFALGNGDERAETDAGARGLAWRGVTLPGSLLEYRDPAAAQTRFAWARRTFTVTATQAKRLAVLRWNQITFGAAAYVNGTKVGENAPTGPYQVLLPAGLLKTGANTVVLKIAGGRGAPKAWSGSLLIRAGFGDTRQPPMVQCDVWLDFAEAAYMKWALALPDLASSRVRLRVTPICHRSQNGLDLRVEVRSWPDGKLMGRGRATARSSPGSDSRDGDHCFVDVPMPGFQAWTMDQPVLYTATVELRRGAALLDAVTFRFGMREITIKDGHYLLNGKTLRLQGSELCFEWQWADARIGGHEKEYLVTEAREMSMNAFRTHTMPPPPLWADVCDEGGTMLLAEFPCLYSYQDYKLTPDELATWRKHVLSDAVGWMARLWNHPSVVMWVLSNESSRDNAWEAGPYHDLVRALDPTRPTMRTGTGGTAENYDVHTCGNVEDTVEGAMIPGIRSWFNDAKGRPVTNSEYMKYFGRPVTQWAGKDDPAADALAYAQLGAEHTEAMRRARIDGMLPYMYAGWTRTRTGQEWKAGFAKPVAAAWHSVLSPVLASLDLFDPDYLVGQEVTTSLALINGSWQDAAIHVELLLTDECPEFIPESACLDRPVAKWSYQFALKADTLTRTDVKWKLPDREGAYWLTARTTGLKGRPALSQRFVRAIRPPTTPESLRGRRVLLLGGDGSAETWLRSRDMKVLTDGDTLVPSSDTVVIWNADHVTPAQKARTDYLKAFARAGGPIVVLGSRSWHWPELCDVKMTDAAGSRAFAYPGAKHSLLDAIRPEWMMRWNGLPGAVVKGKLEGRAMESASRLLWIRDPATTVAARAEVSGGGGAILFAGLLLQGRLDPAHAAYDPVAGHAMLALLA